MVSFTRFCYLFIGLFFFSGSVVLADDFPHFVDKAKSYFSTAELESVIYYDYASGTTQRTVFDRDDNDRILNAVLQELSSGTWVNVTMHTYGYDNNGSQVSDTRYTWSANEWKPTEKDVYAYDDNGNLLLKETYQYQSSAWIGTGEKVEKIFNNSNLCEKYTVSTWVNGAWMPLSSGEITYQNAVPSIEIYQYKDKDSGNLINSSKVTYTYAGMDILDTELYQSWSGGAWKNSFKVAYTNSLGLIGSKTVQYVNSSNAWENMIRYKYDYSGYDLSKLTKFDWESGDWKEKGSIKITHMGDNTTYEESGELTSNEWEYRYDPNNFGYSLYQKQNNVLTGLSKHRYQTNNDGLPQNYDVFSWSSDANDWQQTKSESWTFEDQSQSQKLTFKQQSSDGTSLDLKKQIEFVFNTGISTVKNNPSLSEFSVFPNPVKDAFTIRTSDAFSGQAVYCIYNTSGRMVSKGVILSSDQIVNANNLISGQYIVTIVFGDLKTSAIILKM